MKKLMALTLGMSLVFGSATLLAAKTDDGKKDTTKSESGKKNQNQDFGKKVEKKPENPKKDGKK